jgi:hypothetical protein
VRVKFLYRHKNRIIFSESHAVAADYVVYARTYVGDDARRLNPRTLESERALRV